MTFMPAPSGARLGDTSGSSWSAFVWRTKAARGHLPRLGAESTHFAAWRKAARSIEADQEMLRHASVSVEKWSAQRIQIVPRLLDEVSWIKPYAVMFTDLVVYLSGVIGEGFTHVTDHQKMRQRAHWTPRASVLCRGPWRRFRISFTAPDIFWSARLQSKIEPPLILGRNWEDSKTCKSIEIA